MSNEASVSGRIWVTQTHLNVDYTIRNTSAGPVFVLDVAIASSPEGPVVLPGGARREIVSGNELVLYRKLYPIPRNRSYAVPPRVYAVRIESGAFRRIEFSLPLPITPSNAVGATASKEVAGRKVTLVVGVIPASELVGVVRQEIGTVEVWRLPVDAWEHQRELRLAAEVVNLPLLVAQ